MQKVICLTLVCAISLVSAGCAREDPEARLPDAYEKPLQKAQQVEGRLQDSTEDRLRKLDANDN